MGRPTYGVRTRIQQRSIPLAKSFTVSNSSRASTVVNHTEYWDSMSFLEPVYAYEVNPGIYMNPWLARIALNFEIYRVRSMSWSWIPSCPATSSGAVSFAFDYDAHDAVPTSAEMMSYTPYVSANIYQPMTLVLDPVSCNRLPWHYTRAVDLIAADIKTYDIGKFLVYASGLAAGTAGIIMFKYSIEFSIPTLEAQENIENNYPVVANRGVTGEEALPVVAQAIKDFGELLKHESNNHDFNYIDSSTPRTNAMLFKAMKDFDGILTCTLPRRNDSSSRHVPNAYEKLSAYVVANPGQITEQEAIYEDVSSSPACCTADGLNGVTFVKQLAMKMGQHLIISSLWNISDIIAPLAYYGSILMNLAVGTKMHYASNDLVSSTIIRSKTRDNLNEESISTNPKIHFSNGDDDKIDPKGKGHVDVLDRKK